MKKLTTVLLLVLAFCVIGFAQKPENIKPKVSKAAYFDKTPPLTEMKIILPGERDRSWKDGIIENDFTPRDTKGAADFIDPLAQKEFGQIVGKGPLVNIDGVGNVSGVYPPDTDGDVGPNHYFQMINLAFAIFDKSGTLLYGPVDNSTLWSGFVGPWTGHNDGDPILLYDEMADRWIATQFAVQCSNGKSYELVAVSQTGDPLGEWYRYAFEFDHFNDYPKFGVWPDGYYSSYHMFQGGFIGAGFASFDREAMLEGDPEAQMVYFGEYEEIYGVLPADLDGPEPPEEAPNYFMTLVDHIIRLYEFKVDWETPGNSSFELITTLTPEPYSSNVNRIPQPGTTNKLDDLAGMLMYRLQYRNFGDYEVLLTNHTVATSGKAAVRWYELRKENGEWDIYQQGTYSPDDEHRWMGSIAMNGSGDIALGYSVSSSEVYPGIRVTGRDPEAPLGEMNFDEITLYPGFGSQGSMNRWGDYSAMSVDPSDDSTFWFTTEYMNNSGWRTRIISFNFEPFVFPTVYAGQNDTTCWDNIYQTSGQATSQQSVEWSTSGDGHFNNSKNLTAQYIRGWGDIENGEVQLKLTAYGYEPEMIASDSMLLKINRYAECFAGNDTLICIYHNLLLNATAEYYSSVKWTTAGDGNFEDTTSLSTIYIPGPNDILNGSAELTLTAFSFEPCDETVTDELVLTLDPCLGINEIDNNISIEIIPNPTNGVFTYSISSTDNSKVEISIINQQGQVLFNQKLPYNPDIYSNQIDMTYFDRGTYFLRVKSGENIAVEKIVLR